jgi:hypothetical protein
MKRIVFVCSHLYSGSGALCEAMNGHPRIQSFSVGDRRPYTGPEHLLSLAAMRHKRNDRSAVYLDQLLFNTSLSTRAAYSACKFVYVVREPAPTLHFLVANEKRKPSYAVRYYLFRLRRLCEMAKRTGGVLLTWEDLATGRCAGMVQEYLGLREPIPYDPALLAPYTRTFSTGLVAPALLAETENTYEKYLYFLKRQGLRHYRP